MEKKDKQRIINKQRLIRGIVILLVIAALVLFSPWQRMCAGNFPLAPSHIEADGGNNGDSESAALPEGIEQVESPPNGAGEFSLQLVPEYWGMPWAEINGDVPYFREEEITDKPYESYGELDYLGRCTAAMACLGFETMPAADERRGDISEIRPTGWKQTGYDVVDSYNVMTRAHLIAYMLSAENANERNLVTGTRYMNADGMLPFEEETRNYIFNTGNHVMYRVTPVFEGDNLMCSGVLMEALSVEDGGEGLNFCVFVYNVQPGIAFNYANGRSYYNGIFLDTRSATVLYENAVEPKYIVNTRTMKVHVFDCKNVEDIAPECRREFTGDVLKLIEEGCVPCRGCLSALAD